MPKLPDLNTVPTATPQPNLNVTDYSGAQKAVEQQATAVGDIGQTLQKFGQDVQQKQDTFDTAQAKGYVARQSIDAASMFENDNDYATYEQRYTERMKAAAKQAEGMISNPQQRALFGIDTEVDFARGLSNVKKQAVDKEHEVLRGSGADNLNQNLDQIVKAPDEAQRVSLINNSKSIIRGMQDRGAITQEQAVDQWETFRKNMATRTYSSRLETDPGGVVTELAPTAVTPEAATAATDIIQKAAAKHGADPTVMAKTMAIESHGNVNAVSPTGAKGAFQFTSGTASQYGVTDPTDLNQAADGTARLQVDNKKVLTQKLGRDPSGDELYLAHQQGATGASALIANPDKNAIQALEDAGVTADKAQQSIMVNGGNAKMTAGEFASMWKQKYDSAEAPGHVYAPVGTMADALPVDERQKYYKAAANQVIANRMATHPEQVDTLLQQPQYKNAFTTEEADKLRADARTQFKNLEENDQTDHIMSVAAKNTETFDAFKDGTLTNSRLSQLEAAGEIDSKTAGYMRQSMASHKPVRTTAEMAGAMTDLSMRMADFGIKGEGIKAQSSKGTAEDLMTFQRDVMKSATEGFITEGEAQTLLKNVNVPLAKKVNGINKRGLWESLGGSEPNTYQKGFRSIDTWFNTSGQEKNTVGKAEVMRRYALALNEVPEDQRDAQAPAVLNMAVASYKKSQFPVLQMMDQLPNAVITKNATRSEVLPQSTAKPDATVTSDYVLKRDAKGRYAKVFSNGTFERVDETTANQLRAKGH